MSESLIHRGEWLSFYTIGKQATEFFQGLTDRDRTDFSVAATILETSVRTGRPPAGRSERIEGSRLGLFELRITPPGRRGPHIRALYVRSGRKILVARGLRKRQPKISRRDIELAERAVRDRTR